MSKEINAVRLALAISLVAAHAVAPAQDPSPNAGFRIKEETPTTGSNIKRDTVWGGSLPFDKAYAQLSPEQQQSLKSRFVQMGEGDEPPFPVDGLGPLIKAIIKVNELVTDTLGRLELEVLVDASGTPTRVDVLRSPDPVLARHAAALAMLTRFKPALCKGSPCAMGFPVGIDFVRR